MGTETQEKRMVFSATKLANQILRRGLKRTDVANAMGVACSTITYWCSGEMTPSRWRIRRLAQVLRCSMSYFFVEEETVSTDSNLGG